MKRTTSILLICLVLFGFSLSNIHASFPDVSSDYIYKDAIEFVQQRSIVDGFSDGTFRPENEITRAEFTKIIVEALYGDYPNSLEGTYYGAYFLKCYNFDSYGNVFFGGFKDVENYIIASHSEMGVELPEPMISGNIFSKYTCIARENGLVNGYSDNTFRPDNKISVGEMAKIISNGYKYTSGNGVGDDKFKVYIDSLALRQALPTSLDSLSQNLKRGEMAEIIYRLDMGITNKPSVDYEDLKPNAIAY